MTWALISYDIRIHSFVLMENHYHLILETPQDNLLKVMHGINGRYTGYFNRKYRAATAIFSRGDTRGYWLIRMHTFFSSAATNTRFAPTEISLASFF